MPGLNQRGPMNQGPMTGRGTGRCAAPSQGTEREWRAAGYGQNRGMGRRRCQQNRWRTDMPEAPMAFDQQELESEESLTQRARKLELELESIKSQLEQRK